MNDLPADNSQEISSLKYPENDKKRPIFSTVRLVFL